MYCGKQRDQRRQHEHLNFEPGRQQLGRKLNHTVDEQQLERQRRGNFDQRTIDDQYDDSEFNHAGNFLHGSTGALRSRQYAGTGFAQRTNIEPANAEQHA